MMRKFQSSTKDLSLPHVNDSYFLNFNKILVPNCFISYFIYTKPLPYKFQVDAASKLTLTRPKEPEFETAQRVRSIRVKSTAELEEEMMAKIPKFKARPLNKKVKFIAFVFFIINDSLPQM